MVNYRVYYFENKIEQKLHSLSRFCARLIWNFWRCYVPEIRTLFFCILFFTKTRFWAVQLYTSVAWLRRRACDLAAAAFSCRSRAGDPPKLSQSTLEAIVVTGPRWVLNWSITSGQRHSGGSTRSPSLSYRTEERSERRETTKHQLSERKYLVHTWCTPYIWLPAPENLPAQWIEHLVLFGSIQ